MTRRYLLWALLAALAASPRAVATAGAPPAFEEIRKIDVHSHIFEDLPEVVEMMDRTRFRIVNVCVRGTDLARLREAETIAERQQAKYGRERFPFASTFDLTRRDEADYVDQVKRWLDASFEKGALMVKIWKEVGMEIKDRQGRFILPDNALFDPIYAFVAERKKPLLAHLAEPLEAWLPLNPQGVHYGTTRRTPSGTCTAARNTPPTPRSWPRATGSSNATPASPSSARISAASSTTWTRWPAGSIATRTSTSRPRPGPPT